MKILAIETSCDETCAALIADGQVVSNVVWSQVDLHKEFGGVVPSIARRAHEEKIGWVVEKALAGQDCDAVAVTVGPGLAIALEVGIKKAKELNKPFIAVNHIEGHVLSGLTSEVKFPALALVVSGGHTELIYVEEIGHYQIIAQTMDDALGEAVDKAARILGLGYPGGAELEKRAALGNPKIYPLPLPMAGRENQNQFSYSGLKAAFFRLVNTTKLDEQNINDLATSFQDMAFKHLLRITKNTITSPSIPLLTSGEGSLLVGGGVAANQELRKRLSAMAQELGLQVYFPIKGMYGDNAAMIGRVAHFKALRGKFSDPVKIDRLPRWKIDESN